MGINKEKKIKAVVYKPQLFVYVRVVKFTGGE